MVSAEKKKFTLEGGIMMKVKLMELVGRNALPTNVIKNEKGAIGYILAWLLGVPASVLLVIMLLRG